MKNNVKKRYSWKFKITVFVLSFVFTVFLIEILLSIITVKGRYGFYRYIRLKEWMPYTSLFVEPPAGYLRYTDNLKKKKYRFEIDDEGYIFPSRIYKKPDVTIIFLGGSTTECLYVDEKNRFPYLVGRIL